MSERGAALLVALLLTVLVGAIAAALVAITTTETLISASYRRAQEVSFGADAALERALHDLGALPDWSQALAAPPGNVTSTFDDGQVMPVGPDGQTLDLARLTVERQRESDARDGAAAFGLDTPQWRLFAHATPRQLGAAAGSNLPLYFVVWVADDESDGDDDPTLDSNDRLLVRAVAFGVRGARRAVEARVGRTPGGDLRLQGRHRVH